MIPMAGALNFLQALPRCRLGATWTRTYVLLCVHFLQDPHLHPSHLRAPSGQDAFWTTSGDLALAVRCVVDDDDRGGSGPAIDANAGGGANGEGETDADVDTTPRPTGGGTGIIWYFDTVVVVGATTGVAITNCDLDF